MSFALSNSSPASPLSELVKLERKHISHRQYEHLNQRYHANPNHQQLLQRSLGKIPLAVMVGCQSLPELPPLFANTSWSVELETSNPLNLAAK